jgi:hypothetical protein
MIAAFTLAQILNYPFPSAPVRDAKGTAIAYTLDTQGVRTIWFARGPEFAPKQLFSSSGDDGHRNVEFHQMVDLVARLRLAKVPFEEIVIPNEIHGFLRYASWLEADTATIDYFSRHL